MHIRNSQRTWLIFLIIGIVTIVGSALVSFAFIRFHDSHVMESQREIDRIDDEIRNLWQQASLIERRADSAVIAQLLTGRDGVNKSALIDYYTSRVSDPHGALALLKKLPLLEKAQGERVEVLERINGMYGERLEYEVLRHGHQQQSSFYTALAIFLQVIGLVIITITRDLRN